MSVCNFSDCVSILFATCTIVKQAPSLNLQDWASYSDIDTVIGEDQGRVGDCELRVRHFEIL